MPPLDRGQTTADFAVGVGVFLIVAALVFGFLPGLDGPDTRDGTFRTPDRVVNTLGTDVLGSETTPWVLDDVCTERFFNGTAPRDCSFDRRATVTNRTQNNLSRVLGVDESVFVNVTITSVSESRPATLNTTGDPTPLRTGRPVPAGSVRVGAADRTVFLNESPHRLRVRVW